MTITLLGIIWPVEGMPKFLRYISYALPTTHAAEAMRSIIGRGSVDCMISHVTFCYRMGFGSFGCMERIYNYNWLVHAVWHISNYRSETKEINT